MSDKNLTIVTNALFNHPNFSQFRLNILESHLKTEPSTNRINSIFSKSRMR